MKNKNILLIVFCACVTFFAQGLSTGFAAEVSGESSKKIMKITRNEKGLYQTNSLRLASKLHAKSADDPLPDDHYCNGLGGICGKFCPNGLDAVWCCLEQEPSCDDPDYKRIPRFDYLGY